VRIRFSHASRPLRERALIFGTVLSVNKVSLVLVVPLNHCLKSSSDPAQINTRYLAILVDVLITKLNLLKKGNFLEMIIKLKKVENKLFESVTVIKSSM